MVLAPPLIPLSLLFLNREHTGAASINLLSRSTVSVLYGHSCGPLCAEWPRCQVQYPSCMAHRKNLARGHTRYGADCSWLCVLLPKCYSPNNRAALKALFGILICGQPGVCWLSENCWLDVLFCRSIHGARAGRGISFFPIPPNTPAKQTPHLEHAVTSVLPVGRLQRASHLRSGM